MSSVSSSIEKPQILILESPNAGYEYAEITTVLRKKVTLYNKAPHGYYIAPSSIGGKQYLFKFVKGENAMKAYQDTLHLLRNPPTVPEQNIPNAFSMMQSSRFNPSPITISQQLYSSAGNSNRSKFNYPSYMQGSRMAGPNNTKYNETPSSMTQYITNSDVNSLLPLQEIDSPHVVSANARSVRNWLLNNHDVQKYITILMFLPVDTGGTVEKAQTTDQWPENFRPGVVPWPLSVQAPLGLANSPSRLLLTKGVHKYDDTYMRIHTSDDPQDVVND
ncbi:hypothetical protein C8R42DRAFT_647428 [Lentinula raphanica]|nr:hypothetical protein C8R42DRAFT_647428 [Lentinula raphanica]